jgi:hypothetical protein
MAAHLMMLLRRSWPLTVVGILGLVIASLLVILAIRKAGVLKRALRDPGVRQSPT